MKKFVIIFLCCLIYILVLNEYSRAKINIKTSSFNSDAILNKDDNFNHLFLSKDNNENYLFTLTTYPPDRFINANIQINDDLLPMEYKNGIWSLLIPNSILNKLSKNKNIGIDDILVSYNNDKLYSVLDEAMLATLCDITINKKGKNDNVRAKILQIDDIVADNPDDDVIYYSLIPKNSKMRFTLGEDFVDIINGLTDRAAAISDFDDYYIITYTIENNENVLDDIYPSYFNGNTKKTQTDDTIKSNITKNENKCPIEVKNEIKKSFLSNKDFNISNILYRATSVVDEVIINSCIGNRGNVKSNDAFTEKVGKFPINLKFGQSALVFVTNSKQPLRELNCDTNHGSWIFSFK